MDLLPGPDEDAAVARLRPVLDAHLGVERWAERLRTGASVPATLLADATAAGLLSEPSMTAQALMAVELGRVLAPLDLLAAVLGAHALADRSDAAGRPAVRASVAAPNGEGGHAVFGPGDPDVVVVWDDDGIGIATEIDHVAMVDSIDPTTPMALARIGSVERTSDAVGVRAALLAAAFHAGTARGARDMAVEYAQTRVQFDRPIGANQAVKHLCADSATRSEAAWASVLYASVSLVEDRPDARYHVAVAARIAADAARRNARTNIQVHGGRGYTLDCPAHLFLVRTQILETLAGGARRARRDLLADVPTA